MALWSLKKINLWVRSLIFFPWHSSDFFHLMAWGSNSVARGRVQKQGCDKVAWKGACLHWNKRLWGGLTAFLTSKQVERQPTVLDQSCRGDFGSWRLFIDPCAEICFGTLLEKQNHVYSPQTEQQQYKERTPVYWAGEDIGVTCRNSGDSEQLQWQNSPTVV